MQTVFAELKISREGRSLVEWLDENLRELEERSIQKAHHAALYGNYCDDRDKYICIEQLRLAIAAVRAAV